MECANKIETYFANQHTLPATAGDCNLYSYNGNKITDIGSVFKFSLGEMQEIITGEALKELPSGYYGYFKINGRMYFFKECMLPESRCGKKNILAFYEEYLYDNEKTLFVQWHEEKGLRVISAVTNKLKDILTINKIAEEYDLEAISNALVDDDNHLQFCIKENNGDGKYHYRKVIYIDDIFSKPQVEEVLEGKNGATVILPKKAASKIDFANPLASISGYKYLANYFTEEQFSNILPNHVISDDELAEKIFELAKLKEHLAEPAQRIVKKLLGEVISLI